MLGPRRREPPAQLTGEALLVLIGMEVLNRAGGVCDVEAVDLVREIAAVAKNKLHVWWVIGAVMIGVEIQQRDLRLEVQELPDGERTAHIENGSGVGERKRTTKQRHPLSPKSCEAPEYGVEPMDIHGVALSIASTKHTSSLAGGIGEVDPIGG